MSRRYEIRILMEESGSQTRMVSYKSIDICVNDNQYFRQTLVNILERKSLAALVAYQAYTWNLPESMVETAFCAEFDVDAVDHLPAKTYDDAVIWLVEWKCAVNR